MIRTGIYQLGTTVEITETFTVQEVPTDPTTVTFRVRDPHGGVDVYVYGMDMELAKASTGTYVLTFIPALAGDYFYEAIGTGDVQATSETGTFNVLDSGVVPTVVPSTLPGPCTPWADSQDVALMCDVSVGSDISVFDQVVSTASQLLWSLSGRQFSGACRKTVRPCSDIRCNFQVLSRGHIVWDPTFYYDLYWGGSWWWWNGGKPCGCLPLSQVLLSGWPVRSIDVVKIDGDVVDPTGYRLDEHTKLTRMRDPANPDFMRLWPSCQILDLPDTEKGTFSVAYTYGQDPPAAGVNAAAQLACELYKQLNGADCLLPQGTTRITRAGLTIERTLFARDVKTGAYRTGMVLVDLFLNSYNPSGITRRPASWTPDGRKYARPVG